MINRSAVGAVDTRDASMGIIHDHAKGSEDIGTEQIFFPWHPVGM
jgi:hypothetical protein